MLIDGQNSLKEIKTEYHCRAFNIKKGYTTTSNKYANEEAWKQNNN